MELATIVLAAGIGGLQIQGDFQLSPQMSKEIQRAVSLLFFQKFAHIKQICVPLKGLQPPATSCPMLMAVYAIKVFIFGRCNCILDSHIDTSEVSLVMGSLHMCWHVHV